jgi:tetratricopeptide (TPR) repeat protein/transcriptional regulator with XRE-family HTH domain
VLAVADTAGAEDAARRHRLAQRRRALGLTQEELAALLGIERSTVMRWEHGKTQPLPRIQPKLARALQVPAGQLAELLGGPAWVGPSRYRPAAPPVPRQLPAAVADFTGRTAELAALTRLPDDVGGGAAGTVVISAIGGTAGVGKTALAVYWAHRVADQFPDGQLYVNLRGFDPVGTPATAAETIRGFLDALGVPRERIPPRFDAQAGLYRSLVADRKMLIVLDNARDEQQVRPLLPASPASLILVTSRNQLSGLAADGARLISLDILPHHEALQLLAARLGHARATAEPDVLAEIAELCACLPLALAVTAARAAARPSFPLAAVARELRDAAGRLDALDAGDPAVSVRAVFSWSYQQLNPEAARMFRLLGLHPGPDASVLPAASLAGVSESKARLQLGELARAHLIAEHVPGRFTFHDLLRAYAVGQARACDSEPERNAAIGRVLDHYLHTACRGAFLLTPSHEPITLAAPVPGTAPEQIAGYQQALAWFKAEHQVLLAAVALAGESGFETHAWQLPWAMVNFLYLRGYLNERVVVQHSALAAATRSGDIAGQAVSLRLLANALNTLGNYDQARGHYSASLELHRRLGNHLGEAKVHQNLGELAIGQERYTDALGHAEQALRLFQAVGHKEGEADALNNVGWCHGLLGDYQQTRVFCRQALALNAEVGNRSNEPNIWDSLGYAERHLGNFGAAAACYQRALSLSREFGDRSNEAATLTHVGDTWEAAGELPRAREAWQEALAILEDLQHPGADQVRAKLEGADSPGKRHPPPSEWGQAR